MWKKIIGDFFKNIKQLLMGRTNVKMLEAPQENSEITKTSTSKEEIFDIYNKIKKGEYNPDELDEEKREKINVILKSEIDIKKKQLERKKIELDMLKQDNIANERIRLMRLYDLVKADKVNLDDLENEDLYKIRQLLIDEAKFKDKNIKAQYKKMVKV